MKHIVTLLVLLFSPLFLLSQIEGCTDAKAINYNPQANKNDGSCQYKTTMITPLYSQELPVQLNGTSGLVFFDNKLFSHNDHYTKTLYQIEVENAQIVDSLLLGNVAYQDVEDIDQDSLYVYLGDFGNNVSGNRTDLHILRILKSSLFSSHIQIDTIWFAYADQVDFSATSSNASDYDCEAFFVTTDSIYLFTKQWNTYGTALYALPKTIGTHQAQFVAHYQVDGLITAAHYQAENNQIVLCGYTSMLQPFLLLLYDYSGNNFFSGNKRKIALNLPFHQVEAIAGVGNFQYYLSNEYISRYGVTVSAKLHKIDLSEFLSSQNVPILNKENDSGHLIVYPNPAKSELFLEGNAEFSDIYLYNNDGKLLKKASHCRQIAVGELSSGVYWINLINKNKTTAIKCFMKE